MSVHSWWENKNQGSALTKHIKAKGYKPEYIALSASVVSTTGAGGRDLVLERILSELLDDVKACLKGVPTESIAFFPPACHFIQNRF
jgi:hypothetical protein